MARETTRKTASEVWQEAKNEQFAQDVKKVNSDYLAMYDKAVSGFVNNSRKNSPYDPYRSRSLAQEALSDIAYREQVIEAYYEKNRRRLGEDQYSAGLRKLASNRSSAQNVMGAYNAAAAFYPQQQKVDDYLERAMSYYNSAQTDLDSMTWANAADVYGRRSSAADALKAENDDFLEWLEKNRVTLGEQNYNSLKQQLEDIGSGYDDVVSAFGNNADFYGQFATEDDYLKWDAYSTPEKRQATYQKNIDRLEELKKERDELYRAQYADASTGMIGAEDPGSNQYVEVSTGMIAPVHNESAPPKQKQLYDVEKEIASLEAEINMYQRGITDNNGDYIYGSKVIDDYSKWMTDPAYEQYSGNRDYDNPSWKELAQYDAYQDKDSWTEYGGGTYKTRTGQDVSAAEEMYKEDPGYVINDPVGLFLSIPEQERALQLYRGSMEHLGMLESVAQAGWDGNWEQLTDDELGIYYTIKKTQGDDAAMKYISDMTPELNRRGMYAESTQIKKEFDEANGWKRAGLSAASVPIGLMGGVMSTFDNVGNILQGKEINPYSRVHAFRNYSDKIRTYQAQEFDDAYKWEIPWVKISAGDLYQSGMSVADTLLGAMLGAKGYQAIMSSGAAASKMQEYYEKGASDAQIATMGAAAAFAEWITEKYSIESLLKIKDIDSGKQIIKALFYQAFPEATEEMASEVINYFADAVVMGTESEWQKALDTHDGNYLEALWSFADEVAAAGVSGFFSGIGSGGGKAVGSYVGNYANDVSTGRSITDGKGYNSLMNLALEMGKEKSNQNQRELMKQSERILNKDYATDISKQRDLGRLHRTVQKTVNDANVADISKALQDNGYDKKTADSIADAFYAAEIGNTLTEDQSKVVNKYGSDEKIQQIVGDIILDDESSVGKRNRSIRNFEYDVITEQLRSRIEKAAAEKGIETAQETEAQKTDFNISEDGKAHVISSGKAVDITAFASAKDGKVMLRTSDGEVVPADDVSYANESQAIVFETIANMGIKAKSANILLQGFLGKEGIDAEAYARGLLEAFEYGKTNRNTSGMSFSSALTPAQLDYVYRQGRKAAKKQTGREQARMIQTVERARAVIDQRGDSANAEYTVILEDGLTEEEMTPSQKASYEMIRHIPAAMKGNVRIYDGKTGEFGYYDPKSGDIYLNINSTRSQKSMMAFAMGHELVHRAKDGSPAKYQKFADFLIEQYGKQGSDVEAMIAEQKQAAKDHVLELTDEQAFDEVVADACQRMLLDTNAGQRLAEFGAQSKQNQSIVQDVIQWIRDILEKLRNIFADVDPDSIAAQEFAKFDANVKQILADMYVDMTIDAGEKLAVIEKAFGSDTQVSKKDSKLDAAGKARLKQLQDDGASFMLPKSDSSSYQEPAYREWDVQAALYDAMDHADNGDENMIRVGEMPRYITETIGIEGDFYIYRNHAYENMVSREQAIKDGRPVTRKGENIHFHDLGVDVMTEAIMSLENPTLTIATKTAKGNPAVIMLLPVHGKNKAPLYAVLSFYSNRPINGDLSKKPHIVLTIAERDFFGVNGRSGYAEIVGTAIKDGRVIDFNKEMRDDLSVIANPAGVGNMTDSSLKDNLTRFRKEINSFREKNHIDYKLPVSEDTSPRALLTKALDSVITDPAEKQKLQEYRENIEKMNEQEVKLRDLKSQIKDLSFAPGHRDTQKIKALREEAAKTENRINLYDKRLLRFEASSTLQKVLQREKAKVAEREKAKRVKGMEDYQRGEEVKLAELIRKYRATREALTQQKRDTTTMEAEFIRLVKQYEKLSAKSNASNKTSKDKVSDLRTALKEEAKAHKDDQKQWEKEFDRLLKEYEHSEKRIDLLEAKIKAQRKSASARVDSRNRTEMRKKIRRVIRDLDKLLNRGTKKQNVKEGMRDFVAAALASAEALFTETYTTEDMISYGVKTDTTAEERKLLAMAKRILDQISNLPKVADVDDVNALMKQETDLKKELSVVKSQLKGVFERERYRLSGFTASKLFGELANSYANLAKAGDNYIRGAYREEIYQRLLETQTDIGAVRVADMSLEQLDMVYDSYAMVLQAVRDANKMFVFGRNVTRDDLARSVLSELKNAIKTKKNSSKAGKLLNSFAWNNLKPIYAFERIGSSTLAELYANIRKGQDVWALDMMEAQKFRREIYEKYGRKEWNFKKTYDFTSSTGKQFSLTLDQIMSIYAYYKREQSRDHLLKGGIVFDKNTEVTEYVMGVPVTRMLEDATAYKLSLDTLEEIVGELDDQQKSFVNDLQTYLSKTMGNKGNDVSMQLYGIKLFKEENYFPIKSAGQYMEKTREANLQKEQGQINLVNAGFAKSTVPDASNPIVLSGFMETWANHVAEMSMYHAFVLPMEDFRRVYDFSTPNLEGEDSDSVYAAIQNTHGTAATAYIDQLYRDLNGGAVGDPRENIARKWIGLFKKGAVMASASVTMQQPSAIGRTFALIDPKYFGVAPIARGVSRALANKVTHEHERLWEELKQYAPVALVKEMGYFDTDVGMSATDFLLKEEYRGFDKVKGALKDGNYRDELLTKTAAVADELTWIQIWEAVKNETADRHPNIDRNSERFLQIAGARFSEVIDKTQVYDSVLSRSANMRSKSALASIATSFMAEPTTTANMINDAIFKAKNGDVKAVARVFGAVGVSIVMNAALSSLVYAARDHDEDETFVEKYSSAFLLEMLDSINPVTYYPLLKDVWSVFQGFDMERSDMSVIIDLADTVEALVKVYSKDTSRMSEEELVKHSKSVRDGWLKAADSVGAILGLPVRNVRRDISAAVNVYHTISTDINGRDTTATSLKDVVLGDLANATPIIGWLPDKTRSEKLYNAIISGDENYVERLAGGYKDENAYHSAIRSALRDLDPRIREAAIASNEYDYDEYLRIVDSIMEEGNFERNDVIRAIRAEAAELAPEESAGVSKAQSVMTTEQFARSVAIGYDDVANTAMEDIIATHMQNGKTESEASDSFESSARGEFKDLYLDGDLNDAAAIEALVKYCNMTNEDAASVVKKWQFEADTGIVYGDIKEKYIDGYITSNDVQSYLKTYGGKNDEEIAETIEDWNFEKEYGYSYSDKVKLYRSGKLSRSELQTILIEHGEMTEEEADYQIEAYDWQNDGYEKATAAAVERYNQYCASLRIPKDVYLYIREFAGDTENDYENGHSVRYSAVKKIMAVINSQNLTAAQKTAIAESMGWSKKTIRKYKLW